MNLEQVCFQMIINAGNARSLAMEAIQDAKKYDFESAEEKLKEADASILEAHHQQTALIQNEAQGNHNEINVLLIHAQDHLMTGMAICDMGKELLDVYRKFSEIKEK